MTHPKIFALLILLLTACQPDAPEENAAPPLRVTALQAAPADLSPTLRLPGTLAAREEVAVTAALQGQRILSIAVEVGDRVRAGQVLAQLEHVNVQSQLQQTEAQLARAKAQLQAQEATAKEAAATLQRFKKLASEDAISKQNLDQQQATLNSARAQVQAAKAEISQLQAQLKDSRHQRGKAEIVAPVAGVIARRSASAGALTGGDALFHIIKDNQLELVAEADAGQLALLRPGLTATVTLADGEALPGTVRLLNPTLDGNSRRGAVRIALKTDKALFSGSYGEALLAVPQPPAALTLPETALVYDREGSASVWRVAEDGLVQRRPVQLGRRQRGRVEILHGLGASDRVIGRAGALVDEGDRVSPVNGEQV